MAATAVVATGAAVPAPRWPAAGGGEVFMCADGVSVPAIIVDQKGGGQRYRVVSLLGRGAFGRCYEVETAGPGPPANWACKTLDKTGFNSTKIVERVKYEIKVMKHLPRHKNIVGFHTLFEDKQRLYILMERCTSRTLHDLLLKRRRLTEFESRYFIAQLAEGISALHQARIIHRDIKHSNLLLDRMNRIKIADFGLSTIVAEDGDRRQSFLGTPNFLAPELVMRNGGGHSFGVDVWATGVLLFVMLYGHPPFSVTRGRNNNLHDLYHHIVGRPIAFPPEPHTSTSAQDLINRLCCKSEDRRLPAADICKQGWFLIYADSNVPTFMPDSVFDAPIRNLQEYKAAAAVAMAAAGPQKQAPVHEPTKHTPVRDSAARATGTAAAALFGSVDKSSSGTGKPGLASNGAMRRPLEPIPENVARVLPDRAAAKPEVAGWLARTRAQGRAQAEDAEKENRLVAEPKRLDRDGPRELVQRLQAGGASHASGNSAQASGKSIQANGKSIQANTKSIQANGHGSGCQVQAEFGRVTKLSEGYIPSILTWKDRLQQFCAQTERYLQRPSSALEADLARPAPSVAGEHPRVGMYVLNWMALTKYGLGFRLSDGTTGTLFNDNTSLLQIHGTDTFVYVRPYENRSSIGHYQGAAFPAQLDKKRRLLHAFGDKIARNFSARVDRDIAANPGEPEVIKCLLQALATNVGMVFLLTGNVLQFNMRNHSKLFLYHDSHIFYKNPDGGKWHFDLRQGPEMLIRNATIDIEQFLLCLGYAQKVLATWNLPATNKQ